MLYTLISTHLASKFHSKFLGDFWRLLITFANSLDQACTICPLMQRVQVLKMPLKILYCTSTISDFSHINHEPVSATSKPFFNNYPTPQFTAIDVPQTFNYHAYFFQFLILLNSQPFSLTSHLLAPFVSEDCSIYSNLLTQRHAKSADPPPTC